ncbi:MAG TPA: hypothetical protein DD670_19325 [Planctomycetaceae bacterium]|nr:hypothetical protein [Planctomycetaceae bacterium]
MNRFGGAKLSFGSIENGKVSRSIRVPPRAGPWCEPDRDRRSACNTRPANQLRQAVRGRQPTRPPEVLSQRGTQNLDLAVPLSEMASLLLGPILGAILGR